MSTQEDWAKRFDELYIGSSRERIKDFIRKERAAVRRETLESVKDELEKFSQSDLTFKEIVILDGNEKYLQLVEQGRYDEMFDYGFELAKKNMVALLTNLSTLER